MVQICIFARAVFREQLEICHSQFNPGVAPAPRSNFWESLQLLQGWRSVHNWPLTGVHRRSPPDLRTPPPAPRHQRLSSGISSIRQLGGTLHCNKFKHYFAILPSSVFETLDDVAYYRCTRSIKYEVIHLIYFTWIKDNSVVTGSLYNGWTDGWLWKYLISFRI